MLIKKKRIPFKHILFIGLLPSFIKKIVYRVKGYKVGKKVSIGFGSVIIGKDVEIGDFTNIGFFTIIRGNEIKIGRFVSIGSTSYIDVHKFNIGEDSKINEQVYVGGTSFPESELSIGKRAIIMQMSFLNPSKPIRIGDDTGIGGHCFLFTHGSWLSQLDGFPVTFASITLGNRVWLPWRVFIMPGVIIGDNVVIGANSLVTKDVPANCLIAGSPAKIIKENYPPPLTPENRMEIIKNIFVDFKQHLEFHSFRLYEEIFDSGFQINVVKKKQKSSLIYSKSIGITFDKEIYPDNVLILDVSTGKTNLLKSSDFRMIVDLGKKTRWGKSRIGEEFVHFVSRYGIRFDRMD